MTWRSADGTKVTTTTTERSHGRDTTTGTVSVTTAPRGEVGVTHEWTKVTKNDHGSTVTQKGSETTAPDGETHKTVVTESCDASNNCESKVEESDKPKQTCGATIDCDGGGCNASADPDSAFASPLITTESVLRALVLLGANIRTVESDGSAIDYQPDPARADRWGPVSLVSDEATVGGVLIFRGNNTAGPDYDPDLPQPEVGLPGPDLGRDLRFFRPPARVVSLVPSDTYSLFALGCGAWSGRGRGT